jgi:murein DD-endopeptidase MepM/ murein hydrolase activator NlpD
LLWRRPLTAAVSACLLAAPAAHAVPADFVPEPPAVFPLAHATGYGEWEARYGNFRNGHRHEGQDVFAPAGTPLVATREAVVVEKGSGDGRGNWIALYSREAGETYVYFHMRSPTPLAVGERVAVGRRVGSVGCTGSCFGDHLHFEIRRGRGTSGRTRDPLPVLRALARSGRSK